MLGIVSATKIIRKKILQLLSSCGKGSLIRHASRLGDAENVMTRGGAK